MTKVFLSYLLCMFLSAFTSYSQGLIFVCQTKTIPEAPVEEDSICLLATIGSVVNCRTTVNESINKNSNVFTVNVCYYAICDAGEVFTDTFCLGVLTKGEYSINFSVSYSYKDDSCSMYDSIQQKLEFKVTEDFRNIFIPNVISPNGDGINDFLKINLSALENTSAYIYNRWGNCVYQSNDNIVSWLPDEASRGTYFYIISGKLEGRIIERKGFISVFR